MLVTAVIAGRRSFGQANLVMHSLTQRLTEYLTGDAGFLIVLSRWIFDGPRRGWLATSHLEQQHVK